VLDGPFDRRQRKLRTCGDLQLWMREEDDRATPENRNEKNCGGRRQRLQRLETWAKGIGSGWLAFAYLGAKSRYLCFQRAKSRAASSYSISKIGRGSSDGIGVLLASKYSPPV